MSQISSKLKFKKVLWISDRAYPNYNGGAERTDYVLREAGKKLGLEINWTNEIPEKENFDFIVISNIHLWPEPKARELLWNEYPSVFFCFDEETEVLTKEGWKYFKELKEEDQIATLERPSQRIVYKRPKKIFQFDYNGKMYLLKTREISLCVTPNHKLYIAWGNMGRLIEAEKLFGKQKKFRRTGKWEGKKVKYFFLPRYQKGNKPIREKKRIEMTKWLRFFAWFITEGYSNGYTIFISQSDNKKRKEIKESIREIGFKPKEYSNGIIAVNNVQLASYLLQFGNVAWEKKLPLWLLELSPIYLKIFWETLLKGNGDEERKRYYTTSEKLADSLQELLLKMGSCGLKRKRKGKKMVCPKSAKVYQSKDDYIVTGRKFKGSISDRNWYRGLSRKSVEKWIDYKGKVYCVDVPNHVIYIRRDGKPLWSGNSHDPLVHGWYTSAMKQSFCTVFMSPAHRDWYTKKYLVKNYFVQPHGILDLDKWYSKKKKKNYYLYIGDLNKYKGVDNLYKWAEENPDKELKIYGRNFATFPFKLPNFKYYGWLPEERVPETLAEAKYFIHLPNLIDPCPRMITFAYLSGCTIIGNDKIGLSSYDWPWEDPEKIKEILKKAPIKFWYKINKFF